MYNDWKSIRLAVYSSMNIAQIRVREGEKQSVRRCLLLVKLTAQLGHFHLVKAISTSGEFLD